MLPPAATYAALLYVVPAALAAVTPTGANIWTFEYKRAGPLEEAEPDVAGGHALGRRVGFGLERLLLRLQGRGLPFELGDARLQVFELVGEFGRQPLEGVDVSLSRLEAGGDLIGHPLDDLIDQVRGFVTGHRALALILTVRVAFDVTGRRQVGDGLIGPVVGRNVGEGRGHRLREVDGGLIEVSGCGCGSSGRSLGRSRRRRHGRRRRRRGIGSRRNREREG